jgi:hypothetical protein
LDYKRVQVEVDEDCTVDYSGSTGSTLVAAKDVEEPWQIASVQTVVLGNMVASFDGVGDVAIGRKSRMESHDCCRGACSCYEALWRAVVASAAHTGHSCVVGREGEV